MTNLTRWDPFNEMLTVSTAMDQLLNSAVVPSRGRISGTSLPIDVIENEDAFIVKAVVPGIHPDDLDIQVNDQILTLRGEWKQPEAHQGTTFHLRERAGGRFERTLQLPLPVNVDAVQAQYECGILTLTLPKTESVKPRRITVQSLQGQPRQLEGSSAPQLEEQQVAA